MCLMMIMKRINVSDDVDNVIIMMMMMMIMIITMTIMIMMIDSL
jgi:hypothetical protein